MAFTQSIDFQRPSSQLSIDRKPTSFFDEFDNSDELSMDSSMISPATTTEDRRDDFANSAGPVFSPHSAVWDDASTPSGMPERQYGANANPFLEHSNNPFIRPDSAAFSQYNSHWSMFDHSSENRAPIVPATYEPFNGEYESAPTSAFSQVASSGPAFGSVPQANVRPASVFPSAPTPTPLSTSPPPGKDWMGMADQSHMDARAVPKRMRQSSPPRPYSPFPRRDAGIRKKNARFDIPPERSLATIDHLIANSTNDDEIKELKQQKRLLRNRQAALDSRQRKKQRAEELEDENKKYVDRISLLEEEMHKMRIQIENTAQEKDQLIRERVQFQEQIQELTWEKENMIQEHTLATGDLRKKISVLTERLETVSNSTSSHPSSNEYEFPITSEMHGLSMNGMDPNEWDVDFFDLVMESDAPQQPQQSLVLAPKKKDPEDDKAGPPGLLMLLLLCGAWVASKTTTSAPVTIPRMPDEVRSDAAFVFDDLMKDHGVSTFQSTAAMAAMEPIASTISNVKQVTFSMPGAARSNDRLENLQNHLVRPSKEQEAEEAFSLSVKQYDSLTSSDFTRRVYSASSSEDDGLSPSSTSPGHRRNLADTLKAMREDAKSHSTANVYTRSLLWDRIPDEVVQEFKRMAEGGRTGRVDAEGGSGTRE